MRKDQIVAEVLGEEHAMNPSDIYHQDFKRAIRGYATAEVDAFLERMADIFERLIEKVRTLKEKNEEQRTALDTYRDMEDTLRSALVSSQKFGDEVLEAAKREAQAILQEARLAQTKTELEAATIPRKLAQQIHQLEQQRSRLRVEMGAILETHRKLLDSLIPEAELEFPSGFFDAGTPAEPAPDPDAPESAPPPGDESVAPASPDDDIAPLGAEPIDGEEPPAGIIMEPGEDIEGSDESEEDKPEDSDESGEEAIS